MGKVVGRTSITVHWLELKPELAAEGKYPESLGDVIIREENFTSEDDMEKFLKEKIDSGNLYDILATAMIFDTIPAEEEEQWKSQPQKS